MRTYDQEIKNGEECGGNRNPGANQPIKNKPTGSKMRIEERSEKGGTGKQEQKGRDNDNEHRLTAGILVAQHPSGGVNRERNEPKLLFVRRSRVRWECHRRLTSLPVGLRTQPPCQKTS